MVRGWGMYELRRTRSAGRWEEQADCDKKNVLMRSSQVPQTWFMVDVFRVKGLPSTLSLDPVNLVELRCRCSSQCRRLAHTLYSRLRHRLRDMHARCFGHDPRRVKGSTRKHQEAPGSTRNHQEATRVAAPMPSTATPSTQKPSTPKPSTSKPTAPSSPTQSL
eukprot:366372-Chlamydomonas_euryale.AAC.8